MKKRASRSISSNVRRTFGLWKIKVQFLSCGLYQGHRSALLCRKKSPQMESGWILLWSNARKPSAKNCLEWSNWGSLHPAFKISKTATIGDGYTFYGPPEFQVTGCCQTEHFWNPFLYLHQNVPHHLKMIKYLKIGRFSVFFCTLGFNRENGLSKRLGGPTVIANLLPSPVLKYNCLLRSTRDLLDFCEYSWTHESSLFCTNPLNRRDYLVLNKIWF